MAKKPKQTQYAAPPTISDSSSSNVPSPIGVPDGYYAPLPGPTGYVPIGDANYGIYQDVQTIRYTPPRYYDGDQYDPGARSPAEIAALQQQLAAVGAYGQKKYTPGVWDANSVAAYESILGYANSAGVDFDTIIARIASQGGIGSAGGGGGGGLGAAPMTDDDIRAIAQKAAQGIIGRNLRDDEVGNFIPAFRGVISTGTSGSTAATDLVRSQHNAEAGGYGIGGVMQAIEKSILAGGQ